MHKLFKKIDARIEVSRRYNFLRLNYTLNPLCSEEVVKSFCVNILLVWDKYISYFHTAV